MIYLKKKKKQKKKSEFYFIAKRISQVSPLHNHALLVIYTFHHKNLGIGCKGKGTVKRTTNLRGQ